ncbi:MAG: DUF1963 domain-containing protein [Aphanocapsa sp. GSE-SYN-MK-11-07L]|jgi:uncharacterized protein YwqG|nr:DUF1963 domain-containing protein [Aphanocapsa sp. GSE-SYN-MK-11-07L]
MRGGADGDTAVLYFLIRKQDLEKQDFSNAWCEIQWI